MSAEKNHVEQLITSKIINLTSVFNKLYINESVVILLWHYKGKEGAVTSIRSKISGSGSKTGSFGWFAAIGLTSTVVNGCWTLFYFPS